MSAPASLVALDMGVMHSAKHRMEAPVQAAGVDRSWTKRESRSPAWVQTFVISANGGEIPVVLTNLSTKGCRIRASQWLTAGERVWLKVPRLGRVGVHIVWAKGGDAGAEFVLGTDIWEQRLVEPCATADAPPASPATSQWLTPLPLPDVRGFRVKPSPDAAPVARVQS